MRRHLQAADAHDQAFAISAFERINIFNKLESFLKFGVLIIHTDFFQIVFGVIFCSLQLFKKSLTRV
jgi:hypothetical protein